MGSCGARSDPARGSSLHLALRAIDQPGTDDLDREQALQRFVDQVVLRQEALQTRIVQVDDTEVSAEVCALDRAGDRGKALARVMRERGLSPHDVRDDVRAWIRDQLIVRAFIDRRV
jgi:hypothetical protein